MRDAITEILSRDNGAPLHLDPSTGRPPKASGDFSIGGMVWPGLSKLIEECGEVLQVGGKLIGSEGRTDHWSGDLRMMLVEELGDLSAALNFFVDHNGLDRDAIAARRDMKRATFEEWHIETLATRDG